MEIAGQFRPMGRAGWRRGFTLIELLVVIAIIAIVIAILVPVFATVREKERQTQSMSNLNQIQQALGRYYLDNNHTYPTVLFGYYDNSAGAPTMIHAFAEAKTNSKVQTDFPGLYPEYISDIHVFEDPDNQADENTPTPAVNVLTRAQAVAGTKLTPVSKTFFAADAYDVSPYVSGKNTVNTAVFVPRYQLAWTDIPNSTNGLSTTTSANYQAADQRQLLWGMNATGDTYVTCTTYHVAAADKVLVLFKNGSAKAMDTAHFFAGGPDVQDITTPYTNQSPAKFWTVSPTR